MNSLKITAGLGSVDDYEAYIRAGADELFLGYVPESFVLAHGTRIPLNRREVLYYNVQIGSESELLILRDMIDDYGISASITLNSLRYDTALYPGLANYVIKACKIGFKKFIIADQGLIEYLCLRRKDILRNMDAVICISGEFGELNDGVLSYFERFDGIKQIIFPRQTSTTEMKMLHDRHPGYEYEAFALNEKCHFTGAYCNSLHCDELCHICKIPYKLCGDDAKIVLGKNPSDFLPEDMTGATGCGLCALWKLREAGVTWLKLVSRGNGARETCEDIKKLRMAITILDESLSEEEYLTVMKKEIFPHGCNHNCYY